MVVSAEAIRGLWAALTASWNNKFELGPKPGIILVTEGLFGLFSRLQAVHSFDHKRSPC
jgi:hypothetical protein